MSLTTSQLTVQEESLKSYRSLWRKTCGMPQWSCLCMLPPWIESWWEVFGDDTDLAIFSFRVGDKLLGIAPLQVAGKTAGLLGDAEVCDYLDFIVKPGEEKPFFDALFQQLNDIGISVLDLRAQRPDSSLMRLLAKKENELEDEVVCEVEDETYELELPSTWDAYLGALRGKDRHEIRRKWRRLNGAGKITQRKITNAHHIDQAMSQFLELFGDNRTDKADFMTDQMATYFRTLGRAAAREDLLTLQFVDIDGVPAAAVMSFDYQGTRYLYNNGYARRYRSLSIGQLSKGYSIRDGIDTGLQRYDFLKGSESYKRRMGGRSLPIYRCRINL